MVIDGYDLNSLALEEEVTRPCVSGAEPTIGVRLWLDPYRNGAPNRSPLRLEQLRRQVAGLLAGREWKRMSFDAVPEMWCWARLAEGAEMTSFAGTYEVTFTLELKSAAWYGAARNKSGTDVSFMVDGTAPTYPTIEFDASESLVIDGEQVVVDSVKPCVWDCENGVCVDEDGYVAIPATVPTPAFERGMHNISSSGEVFVRWYERWL